MSDHTPPKDAFTLELRRIDNLLTVGQLPQAAQALNQAQARHPGDARIYLLGMRLAEMAGNGPGALVAAERAVNAAPQWTAGLMEAALMLMRQGRHADALPLAQRAMTIAPDDLKVVRRAVLVALKAGHAEAATAWLRKLVVLAPYERQFRDLFAKQLLANRDAAQSKAVYDKLLDEQPADAMALSGRIQAALALGDLPTAEADARALLAQDPANPQYQYWLALARGETPDSQPDALVQSLFDGFADRFDVTLWRQLEYRVPQLVADFLLKTHPDRRFNVLDLGCGTGLVGVCLGPLDGFIIGVDLSEAMIEKAAQHGVYARFHRVSVLDALRETPADHYEAITCCDVLVYVGDLSEVIPNALRILKPGGHFLFSCETAQEDEPDMVLRATGRYAHKASAVQRWCEQAGFENTQIDHLPKLRMEAGAPLPGFLVTARKAGAPD
ncbi:methyltransferase domain-containing protein [Ottowia sp.]|uniref:methyltransferase domain-containing protein n=1 Tax=Ottowia sp. TaxID=1898956 RepID=UPI002CA30892|nr:methyltransferase domain-containing protein [Ottowia sp.]HOB66465.1 methyltransferase domain-containing protein [Ottowia sp.]HPZ57378.1 methyltransferase domain-containing protein [Ottowia sp.]HQD48793.1 methyltransferase domain-containing protein [Ottowia sp.]